MFSFWMGFILGVGAMLLITLVFAVWFIVQTANFHSSWINKKETK